MKRIILILLLLIVQNSVVFAAEISNDAKLQHNQGVDYYKIGEYDKAMTCFRRAISLSPDYIDAYYNLGSILEYLDQNEQALTVFKQIIMRAPEDYEAVYKAAVLSKKLNKYDSASSYLELIPRNSKYGAKAQQLSKDLYVPNKSTSSMPQTRAINSNTNLYEGLNSPTGVVTDNLGNIYIASFTDNNIVKISPNNTRMVYVKSNLINGPIGMAIDYKGNLYVANYNSGNIVKIDTGRNVKVLLGNLKQPYGLYLVDNVLLISLQGMHSVLKYKLSN